MGNATSPTSRGAEAGESEAKRIMDAAWPEYGGNHQTAEFWEAFTEGVTFALAAGPETAGKYVAPGYIPMPTNADEAKAMWLIGERWIRDRAPELIAASPPAPGTGTEGVVPASLAPDLGGGEKQGASFGPDHSASPSPSVSALSGECSSRGPAEDGSFYQYREIGEGQDWQFCSKAVYDSFARDPHMDTREVPASASRTAASPLRQVQDQLLIVESAVKADLWITQRLADSNWRPSRMNIEAARNAIRDATKAAIAIAALGTAARSAETLGSAEGNGPADLSATPETLLARATAAEATLREKEAEIERLAGEAHFLREVQEAVVARWRDAALLAVNGDVKRLQRLLMASQSHIVGSALTQPATPASSDEAT